MKTKHTPGEWRDVGSHVFASTQTEDKMYNICKLNNKRAEYKANSALISAAPDILEALKKASFYIAESYSGKRSKTLEIIQKAIAKAEGK